MRFVDRVVWITGASSGIGEGLAVAFAKEGAQVILSARRESELQRVKAACGGTDKIAVLPLDLENLDAIKAKTAEALGIFGRIDMLVNNAGITQRSLAKDTDIAVDARIMHLDYLAQVAITKTVLPHMLARKFGQIVVISSVAGFVGTPYRSSYAAAKHALRGFFDSLRAELFFDNIKVTLVYPGYIKTDITLNALSADGSKFNQMGAGQVKGLSPAVCAAGILDGVAKQKDEVFVGGPEIWTVYAKRFFPSLVARVLRTAKVL